MKGLIINLVAILIGGLSGNFVGTRLSSKYKDQIMSGLSLSIFVVGMESALKGSYGKSYDHGKDYLDKIFSL